MLRKCMMVFRCEYFTTIFSLRSQPCHTIELLNLPTKQILLSARNVTSLLLLYRYFQGKCSAKLRSSLTPVQVFTCRRSPTTSTELIHPHFSVFQMQVEWYTLTELSRKRYSVGRNPSWMLSLKYTIWKFSNQGQSLTIPFILIIFIS